MKTIELASDVIAGSTTFAGLIIVYIGAVATSYGGYDRRAQAAVRDRYRRKAAIASVGIGIAASAACSALLGKWASSNFGVALGAVLMVATLICGVAVAVETVREIN